MRLEEAFSRLLDVECQDFVNDFSWHSMNMWPLVRQCLWFELIHVKETVGKAQTVGRSASVKKRIFDRVSAAISALRCCPPTTGSETTAFISRPVYLQELPNGDLFDRILDPLVFCMPSNSLHSKYYVQSGL